MRDLAAVRRITLALTFGIALLLCASLANAQEQTITLWGQGFPAKLQAPHGARWKSNLVIDEAKKWSSSRLRLPGLTIDIRLELDECKKAVWSQAEQGRSTKTVDQFEIRYFDASSGSVDKAIACGDVALGRRTLSVVVRAEVDRAVPQTRDYFEAVFPVLRQSFVNGRPAGNLSTSPENKRVVTSLRMLDGKSRVLNKAAQRWIHVKARQGGVKYQQVAPYLGTTMVELMPVPGNSCTQVLSQVARAEKVTSRLPLGYESAVAGSASVLLCRRSKPGTLLLVELTSPLAPERALRHVNSFLIAIAEANASGPGMPRGGYRVATPKKKGPKSFDAQMEELLRERSQREERARKEAEEKNRHAKKETISERPLDGVFFADLGWRVWLDPPSRVPKVPKDEEGSGFGGLGTAYSGHIGGILNNIYGAVNFDLYSGGDVRSDTTPLVMEARVGLGAAAKSWSEGGPVQLKSYSYESLDQYGNPCPKIDKNEDPILIEAKMRGVKCNKTRVTETTTTLSDPPGWTKFWAAGYGGWRHASDMLGGYASDAMRPLNSGGGPVLGVTAFFSRGALAADISQELAYYVHGWDDHGSFGYNGRVGFGAPYALMDLSWRLDSAVGKEFMFGIRLRYDHFLE